MSRLLVVFGLLYGVTAHAAIYGVDNRTDISKSQPLWQQKAAAVAVSVPSHYLLQLDDDHYFHEEFDQRPYAESTNLCKDERFANQKTFGHCSAFLIHPKLLVTAGHCFLATGQVENEEGLYCDSFSFWLGYNDLNSPINTLGAIIPKKDVVHCKKIVFGINDEKYDPLEGPNDFAILELTEPVTHIKPLDTSLLELKVNQKVATIGHPHGLPAKFSGLSRLYKNYETTLSSFMDTLGGNSGGPAFNQQGDVVGVLIAGHESDTYKDKKNKCERINRCTVGGKKCDVDTEFDNSNLLMKSQIWQPYIDRYLESQKKLNQSVSLPTQNNSKI